MYSKVKVKGTGQSDLFKFLKESDANKGAEISWNFDDKLLIDKNGNVIKRFTNSHSIAAIDHFIGGKVEL